MVECFSYKSYIGDITIFSNQTAITALQFGKRPNTQNTPLIKETIRQLEEYFSKKRKVFEIPLSPEGTNFQLQVWEALLKIPYGQTKCYAEIAEDINHPLACRAVGNANNKNPLPIFIPCHRVVGKNGKLTGYAGGLEIKQKLLELEQL